MTETATMTEANPFQTVIRLAGGACLPRSLHVVTEIGVADALGDEPRTPAQLAQSVGANPDALARVLRLLAANGVFEIHEGKVSHTPASRLLRSDHPQSMRPLARMLGLDVNWDSYRDFAHSVKTGEPSSGKILPKGFWGYFQENPEAGRIFNAAMTSKAQTQVPAVVAGYDFSTFDTIADIGGGRGHLLQAVLAANPSARGVLFDLPNVIEDARGIASDRLTLQPGDFFKDPLPKCDCYLIMEVIHDWPDAESLAIFRAIRKAARPGAKLLVIEQMVPDDNQPHWSKMLDILMLALLGGKQRTREEYTALLEPAGFAVLQEHPTRSDVSILEAQAGSK